MRKILFDSNHVSYPILIGYDIHKEFPLYLRNLGIANQTKILIITDENVAPLYLQGLLSALSNFDTSYYIVPPGESSKTFESAEKIIQYSIENNLDRSSLIIALGGGMVGDLAGFVASIYMRGIGFIQVPTTILAHDSSIGGKVGINHTLGKNLVGSFYHPRLVIYDTFFLNTLPEKEIKSGFAEVIKHGLIADKDFAVWLDNNSSSLLNLKQDLVSEAVYIGINIKANIVLEDEREEGIRAILNYGHTLAHAIEITSNFRYTHGEAVAIGMVFACSLSLKLNLIKEEVFNFTINLIRKFQLPTSIPVDYETEQLFSILMKDKKFRNAKIRMVLPTEVGEVRIIEDINRSLIIEAIEELKYIDFGGIYEANN